MPQFDSLGGTDDARVTAANAYHQNHGGRVLEPILLPSRVITHTVPLSGINRAFDLMQEGKSIRSVLIS